MSMDKMRAWQLLKDISFVRVAGSDEELKAANILKAVCEDIKKIPFVCTS